MKLKLLGNDYLYECENLIRIFFPGESLKEDNGDYVEVSCENSISVEINIGGENLKRSKESKEYTEEEVTSFLYSCLCEFCGRENEWGMLTGVRPVKLAYDMLKEGKTPDETGKVFAEKFKVSPEKTDLTVKTALNEIDILSRSNEKSVSVYVGIPFCPTRCKYCSFVCEGLASSKSLVEPYIDLLCEEIKLIGEIVKNTGLNVETVYVGGGTPTSVDEVYLDKYLKALREYVGADKTKEFTVEAGRPDTLTKEKLMVLRENGVGRISINPQTLNDEVLKEIGRDHSAEEFLNGFKMAKEMDCFKINVDLIAGLPGDSEDSFKNTVDRIIDLSPDNITVHTLTLKRSAELYKNTEFYEKAELVKRMVSYADEAIMKNGYEPYYLYRQKNTIGALENTGFSQKGEECLYNIYIMDETHSILAAGAGASSKIVSGRENIIRSFNYKFPREYINGFEEIINRKKNLEKEIKKSLQI
jgi:oxygen-independent coproporphyrinogen-3 oxidase